MANIQVVTAAQGTSAQSSAIPSTKVRVTSNVAVHFAVGINPTAYAGNCEIIGANISRSINMQGLGNKIAFLSANSGFEASVVQIGTVLPGGVTSSSDTYRQS